MLKILFIGDIVGRPGRECVNELLQKIIDKYGVSFVIANGENAAGGVGITPLVFKELAGMGINVITSGNHIWDKKEILPFLDQEERLLRPGNYSSNVVPGKGRGIFSLGKLKVAVLNLSGRVYMPNVDCPFMWVEREVKLLRKITPVIIVDFHAEATSEKKAMGLFLNGKVSAVIGTHTHVQTADEQILSKGTAYITDIGMTGPYNSILGVAEEPVIKKFITGLPQKFSVAKGISHFNGVIIELDPNNGCAASITRINSLQES